MTNICASLIICLILATPVLGVALLIRAVLKKPCKKLMITILCCVGAIIPLTIVGALTDPTTWCEHEYVITEEVAPTCTERGETVKECSLCGRVTTEHSSQISHSWEEDSVVEVTCTSEGYTIEKCTVCSATQKTRITPPTHSFEEISRLNPTPSTDGKIVSKCERCGYDETTIIEKLEQEIDKDTKEHIQGKFFAFQFKGSTAAHWVKKFCNYPGHMYIASIFRGTPNDLSYLDAVRDHSDSNEILWGEYYTITATISSADYDIFKTRVDCRVRSNNIIVDFSVEFRPEFEDIVDQYDEGDVITFYGKFYDEGCGFTDAVLIIK